MARMTELANFIKSHDRFAILGHKNPDGDACGSSIVLALALQQLGKTVFVHLPGGVPGRFAEIDRSVDIHANGPLPFVPETAFVVDCGEMNRIGDGEAIFKLCSDSCLLDHHETNDGFCRLNFLDGNAAACAELVVELVKELGVELTAEMGEWAYMAISDDCGQFGFSNTRVQTLQAAADCLAACGDISGICRIAFKTKTEGHTRLTGKVLDKMQLNADKTLCWSYVTLDMYRDAGARSEDKDKVVNYLLDIRGVECACLAEEISANKTKFSLRAKSYLNVGTICKKFGGGGHERASGMEIELPLQEALAQVLAEVEIALSKGQE